MILFANDPMAASNTFSPMTLMIASPSNLLLTASSVARLAIASTRRPRAVWSSGLTFCISSGQ